MTVIVKPIVRVTFTVAGDVASFDSAAFKASVLKLFANADDARVSVSSASIRIDVELIMPSAADAESAASRLQEAAATGTLSSSLGVIIESISTPQVTRMTYSAPAPPPDITVRHSVGFGGMGFVGGLLLVLLWLVGCFRRNRKRVEALQPRMSQRRVAMGRPPRAPPRVPACHTSTLSAAQVAEAGRAQQVYRM